VEGSTDIDLVANRISVLWEPVNCVLDGSRGVHSSMSETARAHEMIENREGFGKVVVIPDSEQ
jgi:hypothetical protein